MANVFLDFLRQLAMGAVADEARATPQGQSIQQEYVKPVVTSLLDAIVPPAAAADASAIPQEPYMPQTTTIDVGGQRRLPDIMMPEPTQAPMVDLVEGQNRQNQLDQLIADENKQTTQDFVRSFGPKIAKRAQDLMADAPEGSDPTGAAALASTEALAATSDVQEPGFFDSAGKFFSDLFGDEERMTRLALAFNSMRFQPDQGLATVLGKRLESIESRRTSEVTANKTVQALKAIGTPVAMKYAAMIQANPSMAKEIYKEYVKSAGTGFDKDLVKGESDLRKEFTGLPTVKDFQSQSTAFGRVVASAKDPSAAGDLALIFNYMKVLDPGSTVREGEFATAQNASGVPGRVVSLYNNIIRGERLNPEQRSDFVDRARRLYMSAASSYENIRDDYADIAKSYQFDVERTVPDLFAQQKDIVDPKKPSYSSLPESVKSKYSAEQFDAMWNGMSYLTKLQLSGV